MLSPSFSRAFRRPAARTPFFALGFASLVLSVIGCASGSPTEQAGPLQAGPTEKARAIDDALSPFTVEDGELRVAQGVRGDSAQALARGHAAFERGAKIEALRHYADAVAADPGQTSTYLPFARILRRVHEVGTAEAALRRLLALAPNHLEARYELGTLLAASGRHSEAAETFDALIDRAPEHGDAHARLAVIRYYLGERADAAASLQQARRFGGRIAGALPGLVADSPSRAPTHEAAINTDALTDIGPAVRLDTGGSGQAVETSIAGRGQHLVAAWNDQREGGVTGVWRLGGAISTDGGASWSDSLVRPPRALVGDFEGDPMSAFDPRTGDLWIGGVTFFTNGSLYVARKRAGNNFFDAPVLVNDDPTLYYDKPLLTAGPGPGAPETTRLYVAFSEGLHSSGDLGATWGPLVALGTSLVELAYQPRVDAAGVLSIISWDSDDSLWLRRSVDGGATVLPRQLVATRMDVWGLQESSRVAGQFRTPPLPSLAVDPAGTLYVVYADTTSVASGNFNLDLYLTISNNGGGTWSTPRVINSDSNPPGDQFAPWLEVDANGRLHVLFYDSRFTPQDDSDDVGFIDLSYAFSDDGGASWHETRITPAPSSSADGFWVVRPDVPDYQFLGDYLALTVKNSGEVVVAYPAAAGGDFDIYSRRLTPPVFVDGFESGSFVAWSTVVGAAP